MVCLPIEQSKYEFRHCNVAYYTKPLYQMDCTVFVKIKLGHVNQRNYWTNIFVNYDYEANDY